MNKRKNGVPEKDIFLWYLSQAAQYPLLNRDEEIELSKLIAQGDESAKEKLTLSNLRLVIKIALDYSGMGLDEIELINEGNIGLMKAVERFDHRKGAKFSTYSSWWIKQSIRRALSNNGTIRIPIHEGERLRKARRYVAGYESGSDGYKPNECELIRLTKISYKRIDELEALSQTISIHTPASQDGETELGDMIDDPDVIEPDKDSQHREDLRVMLQALEELPKREKDILKKRFGLGCEASTLESIGKSYRITRERIRQLQNDAIGHLSKSFSKINRQRDRYGLPTQ